ncbi:MAG: LamG-like jellyroll fold domain-containing protein [Bryobacteraceae bacterium]
MPAQPPSIAIPSAAIGASKAPGKSLALPLLLLLSVAMPSPAQTACPAVTFTPTSDYSYLVASAPGAAPGAWAWVVNGTPQAPVPGGQLLLLHADATTVSTEGKTPLTANGIAYQPGRWGSAFALDPAGLLAYPASGTLDLTSGTLEMWVALRASGQDPQYQNTQWLFYYQAPNGDFLQIAQDGPQGLLYAGGTTAGQWQSAWGSAAMMRSWAAGEWHHIAFTWSQTASRMKFYVDGVLAADTNEGRYIPPSAAGDRFSLGGTLDGQAAAYLVDEVRILGRPLDDGEVKWSAHRQQPIPANETLLALAASSPGDQLQLQYTPPGAAACLSAPYVYPGIPITQVDPPSTLLPPGSTSVTLTVTTRVPDQCRWSLDPAATYAAMQPATVSPGASVETVAVTGLNPDPAVVNHVYLRCASVPDYQDALLYRSLPLGNAPFPRKGNLWGSWLLRQGGMAHAARVDLHLGADYSQAEIAQLRQFNPNILILTSINTVENTNLPEDYYLHDVNGKRIEVWPGSYRLNLTKPYVAEHQANYAYQLMLDSGLMYDGCFFDNFFLTESWLTQDIYGNPVQLDADEDGKPDDPATLDAAWRAGVLHEMDTWRKLMPYALASGHHNRPPDPAVLPRFNGDSIGFMSPGVIDGKNTFGDLWSVYNGWFGAGRPPTLMMIESAPPWQIGYGYGYDPLNNMPASTLEFARTYYPYVRFGLALTLMQDGYFAHEIGDTYHGNDWWYDELNFNLGHPSAAAERILNGVADPANLVLNGGFEHPLSGTWDFWVDSSAGCVATANRDTSQFEQGSASALISITALGTCGDWEVDFHQYNLTLQKDQSYALSFWAKADSPRNLTLAASKQSPDWHNDGLSAQVGIGTGWQQYTVPFTALESVSDARLQFLAGTATGQLWLDDVEVHKTPPAYFRRAFDFGVVLLNPTRQRQQIQVGPGYRRLIGTQAARYEYIVDDADAAFQATPDWAATQYDSGLWKASGPYFHNWGAGCHQCNVQCGQASWDLGLRADDSYTIEAWWPAAPSASAWSKNVVFELVSGGNVVASATVDQSTGGDQWHTLFTAPLKVAAGASVRIRNQGTGAAIADALWVRSAARYNDGSSVQTVTLEAFDGIILARSHPLPARQLPPRADH